jgi:hypothetical protein
VNGGFEDRPVERAGIEIVRDDEIGGWISSSGLFEVWHRDKDGVGSIDGDYLIELNVYDRTSITQDFATTPGTRLQWTFSHRGRQNFDSMRLLIGVPGQRLDEVTKVTTGLGWRTYSGIYDVPPGQTTTRIRFEAIDSGGVGNLLDAVSVRLAD